MVCKKQALLISSGTMIPSFYTFAASSPPRRDDCDLQQGIDNRRVAASLAEMLDQRLQTLTGRGCPELLKGDWQGHSFIKVTVRWRFSRGVPFPTSTLLVWPGHLH